MGRLRSRFVSLRRRLASRRRARDALVGRVILRDRSILDASLSRRVILRSAIARLRHWDRLSSTDTVTTPLRALLPRRSSILVRRFSATEGLAARSKDNSTRVAALLACWPPGPPDVSNRQCSSAAGMTIPWRISSGSCTLLPWADEGRGPSLRAAR